VTEKSNLLVLLLHIQDRSGAGGFIGIGGQGKRVVAESMDSGRGK